MMACLVCVCMYVRVFNMCVRVSVDHSIPTCSSPDYTPPPKKHTQSVLRQDIGWFDVNNSGELATRIKGDTLLVQQGIVY